MRLLLDAPVRERLEALRNDRRVRWILRGLGWTLWLAPAAAAAFLAWRLMDKPAPAPLPEPRAVEAFGLPEEERLDIWDELMEGEKSRWKRARDHFPDHEWSQQDDYAHHLKNDVVRVARERKLHHSIVFLVLDEGIRNHWPGPDGEPLDARPVPLRPRLR